MSHQGSANQRQPLVHTTSLAQQQHLDHPPAGAWEAPMQLWVPSDQSALNRNAARAGQLVCVVLNTTPSCNNDTLCGTKGPSHDTEVARIRNDHCTMVVQGNARRSPELV